MIPCLNRLRNTLLMILCCAPVYCSATIWETPIDQYPITKRPTIFLIKGPCSSGKSTLIKYLTFNQNNLKIVDEDSIVYETYLSAIAARFPTLFENIVNAIDHHNIYPALRYSKIHFKKEITPKERAIAEDSLISIQSELNAPEELSWKQNVSQCAGNTLIARIEEGISAGQDVIVDSWYTSSDQLKERFPDVQTVDVLLYSPFPVVYERLIKRNKHAVNKGQLQDFRQYRQLLSFFSLFRPSTNIEGALHKINITEINETLDKIADKLETNLPTTPKPNFCFQEISRGEFDQLRLNFAYLITGEQSDFYLVSNIHYDLVIDTSSGDISRVLDVFLDPRLW